MGCGCAQVRIRRDAGPERCTCEPDGAPVPHGGTRGAVAALACPGDARCYCCAGCRAGTAPAGAVAVATTAGAVDCSVAVVAAAAAAVVVVVAAAAAVVVAAAAGGADAD